MKFNLKLLGEDRNLDGICPVCGEHTTAGDSCCGVGAYVEGSRLSDEGVIEEREYFDAHPTTRIKLLVDVPRAIYEPVYNALWKAGVRCSAFSYGSSDKWTLTVDIELSQLNVEKV